MKKYYVLFFQVIGVILLQPMSVFGQAQAGMTKNNNPLQKWTISEPFEQKVFIENNEGQLNGKIPGGSGKILYSTRITGVDVYFTDNGITYRYDKFPPPSFDADDKENENKGGEKPETHYFSVQWENANPNVELVSKDEVNFYYCYAAGNKHTVFAHAFKKIIYKNLYPGIDVEYSFPENKKGLEYSIIVHPGADLSQVKLLYKNAENSNINSTGDITLQSSFGEFIDHAPTKVFYQGNNGTATASFVKKGNEISFLSKYDKTKTLIIDPWMVNPLFTGYDAGYDIYYDLKGNAYVYGSFNPYQEMKIDSNGVIQWIFNAIYPNNYMGFGEFAVDEVSGTSYLGGATYPTILKVNTLGVQIDTFYIGSTMEELWRMAYNKCVGQLVIGGGGTTDPHQVCLLDTGLTTLKPYDILGAGETQHDDALLAIDNTSSSIYLAIMQSNLYDDFNNVLVKCSLPSMTTNYIVSDNFSFYEGLPGLSYIDGTNGYSLSPNGAVVGYKWLYLYDGATLRRYNKTNGTTALSKTISGTKYHWSGIDMDLCENLYLADSAQINIYDTGLNNTGTIITGKPIYGLRTTPYNQLIVCGEQFISSFTISNSMNNIIINRSHVNNCVGRGVASANLNLCSEDSSQFTYLWSTGATTQMVTGLSVGTYSVTVSSLCDFSVTDTFSINYGGNNLNITVNGYDQLCQGVDTGNAYVSVLNSNSTFTYLWSTGATKDTVNGLTIGTYSVVVTDSCGDSGTASVNIESATTLSVTVQTFNISCNNENNGAATVNASGGASPYTYSWSNGATTMGISGLSAGVYSVTVTDYCGNISSNSITITQPVALSVYYYEGEGLPCAPLNLIASAGGGTAPYMYKWYPSGVNGPDLTNISYNCTTPPWVVVTDANGCTAISGRQYYIGPIQISQLSSGGCPMYPDSNASITCDVCGGSGDWTLTLSPGGTYSPSPGSDSYTVSGLPAGTYSITVIDNINGCAAIDTFITIWDMEIYTNVISNVSCNGGSNGRASCVLAGGDSPTYFWEPGGDTGTTVSGLSAGTYTVFIRTLYDYCDYEPTITITQPSILNVSANTTGNVSCHGGNNGSASSTVSGGTSPYRYSWSGGHGTNATATGLSAGTYTLTVTDYDGCTNSATTTIIQPAILNVSASTTANVLCQGENDGSASSTVSGGTSPYTYSWSGGHGTNATATGLSAGTYTLTVKDHNGCSATAITTITQPSSLSVLVSTTANILLCNGGNSGSASSVVNGGTLPYTYLWSPSGGSTDTATGLTGGTYTLTVKDHNGCTATASTVITQPAFLSVSVNVTNVICNGDNDGDASSIVSGGTVPYTYSWSDGGTNSALSALTAGTYTLTVTDNNGCVNSATVTITQPGFFTSSVTINANVTCFGEPNGSATVAPTGGTSPYTYLWTPSGETTSTATNLNALIYNVLITDSHGCTATTSVVITQPPALRVNAYTLSNIPCIGGNNGSATFHVNGGTLPYTYLWSGGGGTNLTASNLTAGTYTITVTDRNGCTGTASATITQPDILTVSARTINVSCDGENNGSASANVSGGTMPYAYSWSNGETTANASGLIARTYTLTVIDSCGDIAVTTVSITQPPAISIVSNTMPDPGNCRGSAWVSVSGGTAAYTYSWSPGSNTTDSIYNQCPGNFCCTVTDAHGCTDSVCITIKSNAGIDNISSESGEITVYPNPNNGQFNVESSGISATSFIQVYNVLGQELKNEELKKNTTIINLSAQPNGIYLYRVVSETGYLLGEGKLIIQK